MSIEFVSKGDGYSVRRKRQAEFLPAVIGFIDMQKDGSTRFRGYEPLTLSEMYDIKEEMRLIEMRHKRDREAAFLEAAGWRRAGPLWRPPEPAAVEPRLYARHEAVEIEERRQAEVEALARVAGYRRSVEVPVEYASGSGGGGAHWGGMPPGGGASGPVHGGGYVVAEEPSVLEGRVARLEKQVEELSILVRELRRDTGPEE